MKKIMIAAMMIFASSAAFAGDSEPLKAILKAKTYAEGANLLKSNLSQLLNAEEKAKAYNKLVDLAMDKVSKEQAIINSNQMAEQFKQGKVEPYDTVGMYKAVYDAMSAAMECDKYDNMPNEKGKVKAKFHNSNRDRLYGMRAHLINAGQEAGNKDDKAGALNNFGMYVESATAPLFSDVQNKQPDQYLGEVARVAAVYAYQNENIDLANKYVDVAMKDTAVYKDALNLKLYIAQQQLKTREDSVKYIGTLKDIYVKDKSNDQVFGQLAGLYSNLKMQKEADDLIADKIAADPNNHTAWAMKGQNEMNASKWDDAIASYKKAVGNPESDALVNTYIGFCYNSKAAAVQDLPTQKKLFEEGRPYLEKARSIDPNREKANWSYPLYQTYYVLYGENDSRTKELESMNK